MLRYSPRQRYPSGFLQLSLDSNPAGNLAMYIPYMEHSDTNHIRLNRMHRRKECLDPLLNDSTPRIGKMIS